MPSPGILAVWSSLLCVHSYLCAAYFSFLFCPHLQQHASWFVLESLLHSFRSTKIRFFSPPLSVLPWYRIIPTIFLHVQCGNNFPMQFTLVCESGSLPLSPSFEICFDIAAGVILMYRLIFCVGFLYNTTWNAVARCCRTTGQQKYRSVVRIQIVFVVATPWEKMSFEAGDRFTLPYRAHSHTSISHNYGAPHMEILCFFFLCPTRISVWNLRCTYFTRSSPVIQWMSAIASIETTTTTQWMTTNGFFFRSCSSLFP